MTQPKKTLRASPPPRMRCSARDDGSQPEPIAPGSGKPLLDFPFPVHFFYLFPLDFLRRTGIIMLVKVGLRAEIARQIVWKEDPPCIPLPLPSQASFSSS